jgi:hypothetical protein
MSEIRTPLDTVISFKNGPHYQNLAKELFIDTGIIHDITGLSPGGAKIASEQILDSLWEQFQILANINSKPLHTTTTPKTGKKNLR